MLPERGPNIPERTGDRNANLPDRYDRSDRSSSERSNYDKSEKSVTALVNSYQQRMARSYTEKEPARSSGWNYERQNNNWQASDASQFYSASELGQS